MCPNKCYRGTCICTHTHHQHLPYLHYCPGEPTANDGDTLAQEADLVDQSALNIREQQATEIRGLERYGERERSHVVLIKLL